MDLKNKEKTVNLFTKYPARRRLLRCLFANNSIHFLVFKIMLLTVIKHYLMTTFKSMISLMNDQYLSLNLLEIKIKINTA